MTRVVACLGVLAALAASGCEGNQGAGSRKMRTTTVEAITVQVGGRTVDCVTLRGAAGNGLPGGVAISCDWSPR